MSESAQRVFDAGLYAREALDDALAAFEDFAAIDVSSQGDSTDAQSWVVTVTTEANADYPAELLVAELANYALAQTINRRR